jgi:prepilin-type processing-associated H-X9-DG protein
MVYTDALSQLFYGAGWSVTLAAGDYAVDDGIDSGWLDRNHVPHPAGQDLRGLLHGNVAPRFASIIDGTSNTIMVSKDAGRPDLYLNGHLIAPGTVIPGYQGGNPVTLANEGSGDGWADYNSEFYTDGDYSPNEHTNWSSNKEVNSFHPGGANQVFADGSVHFVKKATAASVFAALISPNGGEVLSADGY